MTIVLTIICIWIALYLAALYGIYRAVFGSKPIKKREDLTYNIPKSGQYQAQRDVMVNLIRNLEAVLLLTCLNGTELPTLPVMELLI